ncbi:hypothetical protein Xkhy_17110 [Xanthomonas axonopodis pv. khayae]|uniref:Uncharacterized protein n=1 Tax=Xanthomonas cassavae CFBP 4642 TaxID=1219375 RepID=A0ABS8HI55_9XANT|nr:MULTISPECIES: hypothetical protein [Xanthomonas]MCC4621883.1 hypothetical protein [Xanthomonas cassavae CFBP 4642]MCC5045789.1 hypothetical protein [Xanthomonas campestris]OOX12116.1 hypothetical protein Xkhy_17110 [Xanthomonas axonopodis pv. khayae]HHZ28875.1 hypothetical protein [Xanthomonas vasicola pv. zeae]HHZ52638.1 hypothetical protein [Xanthomonas vasicola pv. zeae]
MKIIPPALFVLLLAAPAAAMASEPASLSDVLECTLPADKALSALERAGIPVTGQSVPVSNVAAYGVPVVRVEVFKSQSSLGVYFVIAPADRDQLIQAAKLEAWDDEGGAGFRRELAGKNRLNVSHPDDPNVEDGEALATCSMRLRGNP